MTGISCALRRGRAWLPAAVAAASLLVLPGLALAQGQKPVIWGKPSEVLSTDPHSSGDGSSWTVFYLIYDQLLSTDDKLNITPKLAESWEQVSPTSYVFRLRKNAAFSNGRPLTSADVVGSLKRLTDPQKARGWGKQIGGVNDVVAIDAHTVRIDLAKPNTALLSILSVATTSILPMKEIEAGSFDPAKGMLGSGPYKVAQHRQDEAWLLERNPHYWQSGKPLMDKMTIRVMPDDAARLAGLRDGSIDVATFENPDTPRLLGAIPSVQSVVQKTPNYFHLDLSGLNGNSVFKDRRVRQAAALVVDRPAIANAVFGGESAVEYAVPSAFGKKLCDGLPSYTLPRKERVARAKALLKEAGHPNPRISLIASSVLVTYPLIAQVLQPQLQEAGFSVQVQQVPVAEWYKRVLTTNPKDSDFDASLTWFAGFSDPGIVLNWWTSGFSPVFTTFLEPVAEYGDLMAQVRQTPNGPERDKLMTRACGLIESSANMIPLVGKPDYIGFRRDQLDARFVPLEGNFDVFKYVADFKRR
uniref:Extracellular solute-binding protein family 5 n=1 Tax=Variovorax paradoxus (strain S110) TaxID=543728 RepID=C5D0U8_VARPS